MNPTQQQWDSYSERLYEFKKFDHLAREEANVLAQSIGWVVRQRYHWGPKDPQYLALSDIDLRVEYYAIEAAIELAAGRSLPGVQSETAASTENFDDIEAEIEAGLHDWGDDDEVVDLDDVTPPPWHDEP